jgi:hypothetical protein
MFELRHSAAVMALERSSLLSSAYPRPHGPLTHACADNWAPLFPRQGKIGAFATVAVLALLILRPEERQQLALTLSMDSWTFSMFG